MNPDLLRDLLYRLADDDLVLGHRNSEWIGLGPVLEEDIAFASMAQDQIGHALAYYRLLEDLGDGHPDQVAFNRPALQFRSCHLVEHPIQDYAYSLARHLLYDTAKAIRLEALRQANHPELAALSGKLIREVKYPLLHGNTWIKQLGRSTEESRLRLQAAFNEAVPQAYGLFEPTAHDAAIEAAGLQPREAELQRRWEDRIGNVLEEAGLTMPTDVDIKAHYGGRNGYHTEHLQPMLDEMTEVFRMDPQAQW